MRFQNWAKARRVKKSTSLRVQGDAAEEWEHDENDQHDQTPKARIM